MAKGNRGLSVFSLDNLPPAPRGVPQIEVTFDIDANGIVSVFAKDLGTGREQKVTIQASTRLSEDEIKNMVRDAESHAEEDKKRRESIEARNSLDSLIFQCEKTLKESEDKVPAAVKSDIESAVATAKSKLDSEDKDILTAAREDLEKRFHKLAEELYKTAGATAGDGSGASDRSGSTTGAKSSKDDVVDAEYEEGSPS